MNKLVLADSKKLLPKGGFGVTSSIILCFLEQSVIFLLCYYFPIILVHSLEWSRLLLRHYVNLYGMSFTMVRGYTVAGNESNFYLMRNINVIFRFHNEEPLILLLYFCIRSLKYNYELYNTIL